MSEEQPLRSVFVSRHTAAKLLEISVDTFDTWVRAGFVPQAQVNRGQIIRWHWPTVEARLASSADQIAHDPSIVTGRYESPGRRAKK